MSVKYTNEQIEWLCEHCLEYNSYRILRKDFNERFGTDKSVMAIQQYVVKTLKVHLKTAKTSERFTDEEERWLNDNYSLFNSYREMTDEFNRIFQRNKTIGAIRDKCTKCLKMTGMNNSGQYGSGHIKEQCPIGTIRKSSNGSTYIKVKDNKDTRITGYAEPYWLPIQKKIWQDHYGEEVPEGKFIIFLDGNHDNLDIGNLYCIDRKVSACMASNGWYTNSREHTLTAIILCELLFKLKDERR